MNTERIEDYFGNQDLVMVIFETEDVLASETLKRIKKCEQEFSRLECVRKTSSIFGANNIHGENGAMYVEPTVLRIPADEIQKEELRKKIRANDLVYKLMVSEDFQAASVVITLNKGVLEDTAMVQIQRVLDSNPGLEKIHFGGLPYLMTAIKKDIKRDALILVPIALMMMIIFLFLVFREWKGVWLPFLVVILSSLVGISLIPILGWKFYIITLLVPIMLIAVANDYGIHMIARYQELSATGKEALDMKETAVSITRSLWRPVLLTGLTTIAGISALWAHTIIPARQAAVAASAGVLLAMFYSLVLLPATLSLLKQRETPVLRRKDSSRLLEFFSNLLVRTSRLIPPIALGITLLMAGGIFSLKVDSNEENFFPEKHAVKKAAKIINGKFGGSENISLLFEGDMLDPAILLRMEHYREELEKHEAVDQTMSFSAVVREISKALNDPGEILFDRIPPTRNAVAQYMEMYNMSGDPEELDQLVDFNYEHAHLMVRINNSNNETINEIVSILRSYEASDPTITAIGGNGFVRAELANKVLTGTYWSLGIALVLIFLLITLIFRTPRAGLLGIIPLAISLLVLFGIMGWTGIRLDVATALLSSIMIGVGVDYTIHFLWRYREERRNLEAPEAVVSTIRTTGRGIIFNALSVIVGFSVLLISSFTPIRFFGLLVVISIFSCLVGALVILPALVLRFRFAFLEPEGAGEVSKVKPLRKLGLKGLRRVAMVFILLLMAILAAGAQEAREIVRLSHDAVKVSSFEALSTLTITDSRGNTRVRQNRMASMSLPDGTEKRIIKFVSPAEVKGTGILIFDYPEKSDDMWIYLPALRKTRRIVSREKSKSFMGSEFSNANLTAPGLDDFSYRILGEEILEGKACLLVEAIPLDSDLEDQYGYSRSLTWIDKNSYLAHRSRYFDFDGELFKTISNREFKKLDEKKGSYMVTSMHAENHENGRSSSMVMDQVAVTATNEDYFTVAYLERQ